MNIKIAYLFPLLFTFFIIPNVSHALVTQDNLVKCPDFSAVYYLAEDGKRYAFPNDKIFFTWYENFDEVKNITCEELATLPLGGIIHYQPGTRLIKIATDPKVYYVEKEGMLRPINSETQARELFGDDWSKRVDDLAEAFFTNYKVLDPLEENSLPDGVILEDENGQIFEYEDGNAVEITDDLDEQHLSLKRRFALKVKNLKERLRQNFEFKRKTDSEHEVLFLRIRHKLKTKFVDDTDKKVITPFRDLTQMRNESREQINRAQTEIERALKRISEYEESLKLKAESQIEDAKRLLEEAKKAFEEKNYVSAEKLGIDAQEKAAKTREEHFEEENEDETFEQQTVNETEDENGLGAIIMDKETGIKYMKSGYASWYKYKNCDCAASPDFPKGSQVEVTAWNGKSVIVTINDWGPERAVFDEPRPIDLDYEAFKKIANPSLGIVRVEVKPISIRLE